MPQSYPAAWSKWETEWLSYHHQDCETKHISGWGCILMTPSHGRRCSNALYVYELDLIWVWSGWGVSIISHSMIQWETEWITYYHWDQHSERSDITVGLLPYDHQPEWELLKHFIYVWSRSDMSMKWMRCPSHNPQHATSEKPSESPTTRPRPQEWQFFKWSQNCFWVIKPTLIGPIMISCKFGWI